MPSKPDLPDTPFLYEYASDISGGVVDFGEEHLIGPNQTAYLLNVEPTLNGQRRRRLGVFPRGTPGGDETANGAAAFEQIAAGHRSIVVQQGNQLFETDGLDEQFQTRATGISLYDTIHDGVQGLGATATATLFWHSAVPSSNVSLPFDPLLCVGRDWSATLIQDVRPRSACWFQSRLWVFNSCATLHGPDCLAWSNILDGRNFSNGNSVLVDPESGDPGVALVPLRTSDAAALLLFKERSVHALQIWWDTDGAFPNSQNTLDFAEGAKLRPIVTRTGCVGTRALTWVPGLQGGDLLFLSREGIRSLNRSATDAQGGGGLPLSWTIQRTIDRINWAHAHKACAAYWDNRAYFAVPVDGSEHNNFVIAYDTRRQSFYFLDWEVNAWIEANLDSQRKFFFFAQSTGTDGQSTVSFGHHLYETDRTNTDPYGEPIKFQEETRAFVFPADGNPATGLSYKKIWRWADFKLQVAATSVTLAIDYKLDDATDWVALGHISADPSDSYPFLPVQLPFSMDSGRIIHKPVSLHAVRPGYRLQLRLTDDTSVGRFNILELRLRATPVNDTFS